MVKLVDTSVKKNKCITVKMLATANSSKWELYVNGSTPFLSTIRINKTGGSSVGRAKVAKNNANMNFS
jgi:hypothetical protein